ncbi:MAG: hypothetical protein WD069_03135 [Planctomycetales bacterium]
MASDWTNPTDSEPPQPPPKRGMSTTTKVVLILVALFGGLGVLCCGGVMWFGWRMQSTIVQNPDQVREATAEIVEMEIPERFRPTIGYDMKNMPLFGRFMPGQMQMVLYQTGGGGSMFVAGFDRSTMRGDPQQQMRDAMRQQPAAGGGPRKLDIEEGGTVVREFEIRGQQVAFTFAKAHDPQTGRDFHQITGEFDGKAGAVMIQIQLPEQEYDEAEIVRMLESIE